MMTFDANSWDEDDARTADYYYARKVCPKLEAVLEESAQRHGASLPDDVIGYFLQEHRAVDFDLDAAVRELLAAHPPITVAHARDTVGAMLTTGRAARRQAVPRRRSELDAEPFE